jgi:hypothetical protein
MRLEPPGFSGGYQHKVNPYCTCIGHVFGAKISAEM